MAARLQRLAQPADVHIDGALLDEHMVAPYLVEQLRAGVHALGMGHEKMQQAEFGRPQVQRLAVAADPVRDRIQAQAVDLDRVVGHLRRAPAQHRLDARHQLARRKRLGDVVVGAGLQPDAPCPAPPIAR